MEQLGAARDYQPRCFWQNGVVPTVAVAVPESEPMQCGEGAAWGPLPGLGGAVVEAGLVVPDHLVIQ